MRIGQPRPLYRAIASELERYQRGTKEGKPFADNASLALDQLEKLLPSGSGIDSGTTIDRETNPAKGLRLSFGYHHMNDGGYYDGWTKHTAHVTPTLFSDFDLRITGRDRDGIKDYLHDTFNQCLTELVYPAYDPITDQACYLTERQYNQHQTSTVSNT